VQDSWNITAFFLRSEILLYINESFILELMHLILKGNTTKTTYTKVVSKQTRQKSSRLSQMLDYWIHTKHNPTSPTQTRNQIAKKWWVKSRKHSGDSSQQLASTKAASLKAISC
jgi:predicted ATP-dependent endonuclease of OLD family